jgi:hypothetical protein
MMTMFAAHTIELRQKVFLKLDMLFFDYLKAIVSPGTKLQEARLCVEGEPLDVDFAIGFENSRRIPVKEEK